MGANRRSTVLNRAVNRLAYSDARTAAHDSNDAGVAPLSEHPTWTYSGRCPPGSVGGLGGGAPGARHSGRIQPPGRLRVLGDHAPAALRAADRLQRFVPLSGEHNF